MLTDLRTTEDQIIALYQQGVSQEIIATRLKTGKHRVNRCIKIFRTLHFIPVPLHPGRPRKVTDAILDFIDIRTVQNADLSAGAIGDEIKEYFHMKLSKSKINQIRHQLHFKYQPPRHTQKLTDDHVSNRVEFCKKMLGLPSSLPLIHFSDESRIVLGDDKQWIWYRRGENNDSATLPTDKFPHSLMVFAVIGEGYKSKLLVIKGSIDSDKYIDNLNELHFIEDLDAKHGALQWIFQQDGASCHVSEKSLQWIEENCDVITDWPSNSPDLSPIELLWAILKKFVRKFKPTTEEELKSALFAAWDSIPQTSIDHLCQGFGTRLRLCLDKDGQSISNDLYMLCEKFALKTFYDSNLSRQPWSAAEDQQLYNLITKFGNKWKMFEKQFPERTSCSLKNRWFAVLSKRESIFFKDISHGIEARSRVRKGFTIPEICFGDQPLILLQRAEKDTS